MLQKNAKTLKGGKKKKNLWYDEAIGSRGCSLSLIIIVLKFTR